MTPEAPTRGYSATKDQLLTRLRRVEGQVRGVQRMVGEGRYCIDVLTQINAIQAAPHKISLRLLDDHARHPPVGPPPARQRAAPAPEPPGPAGPPPSPPRP